ncbi:MAG: FmdB family transcriptional regulator [Gemmatimonadetes bacterium]|nr:MAG: FmdB family transcriptional regulator [Gemmatimonadota bacterium]
MPTYEYKCPKGHLFEKTFPRISAQRFAKCPTCGKRAERQISGGAGLVFKGSGFYQTDYKQKPDAAETAEKAEKAEKTEKTEKTDKPKKKDTSSDK